MNERHYDRAPIRWLAVLVGTAAAAMTIVVILGLVFRSSEPAPTAALSEVHDASLVVRAPQGGERSPAPVGGPDAPEQAAEPAPAEDLGVAPELIVVDGEPGTFMWPLGGTLEQGMSYWHPGIDIGAPLGTPIRATRAGTVTFVGGDTCCSYGSYVLVQHNEAWASRYAHLGSFAVSVGDTVAQGQLIGHVGLTGRTSGPHLHFELLYYGAPVDPLAYLPGGSGLRSEVLALGPAEGPSPVDEGGASAPEPPASPTPVPPEPTPPPTAAIAAAAASWLAESGEYIVDASTCGGGPASSNQWLVTCQTERTGCDEGASCAETKLICVIEDPLTIWIC